MYWRLGGDDDSVVYQLDQQSRFSFSPFSRRAYSPRVHYSAGHGKAGRESVERQAMRCSAINEH